MRRNSCIQVNDEWISILLTLELHGIRASAGSLLAACCSRLFYFCCCSYCCCSAALLLLCCCGLASDCQPKQILALGVCFDPKGRTVLIYGTGERSRGLEVLEINLISIDMKCLSVATSQKEFARVDAAKFHGKVYLPL